MPEFELVALGRAGLPADAQLEDCTLTRFYGGRLADRPEDRRVADHAAGARRQLRRLGLPGRRPDGDGRRRPCGSTRTSPDSAYEGTVNGGGSQDHVRLVLQRGAGRAAGVRPMNAPARVLGLALAPRARPAAPARGGDATAPTPEPPAHDPGPPPDQGGRPGQLRAGADQRLEAGAAGHHRQSRRHGDRALPLRAPTTLEHGRAADVRPRSSATRTTRRRYGIDDEGEFKQAGPVADGALPLTFSSAIYGDAFTGVVLGDIVAIKYDFDGDGQLDTSFGFRRAGLRHLSRSTDTLYSHT